MRKLLQQLQGLYFLLSVIFLFALLPHHAHGQCCLSDSLVLNTGYNPNTGATARIDSFDPEWTVAGLSADCDTIAGASSGSAYVIRPSGAWAEFPAGTPAAYISFIDTLGYNSVGGARYYMNLQRCFDMCASDTVIVHLGVSCDDWVSSFYIGGIPLSLPDTFPQPEILGYGLHRFYYVNDTIYLAAGEHCITINVGNYGGGFAGTGLGVVGSVRTLHGDVAFKKETSACLEFAYCTMPPIVGGDSLCPGRDTVYTEAEPGGTWTSSHTAVATINSLTGLLTSITSGTTTVTYTDDCGRTKTLNVTVNPFATFDPTSNSPVCLGSTLDLYAGTAGCPGCSFHWSGPHFSAPTLDSTQIIDPVVTANAGTYTLTVVTAHGCTSTHTDTVILKTLPVFTPASNGPLCSTDTLKLYANDTGCTGCGYAWTGPSFASTAANPVIAPLITSGEDVYSLTVTGANGCTAWHPDSVYVTLSPYDSILSPLAGSVLCQGTSVELTGFSGGTTFVWTGPGGFTSTAYYPTITPSVTGTYSLTGTTGSCTSFATRTITVIPLPVAPIVSGSTPLCPGSTDDLIASETYTASPTLYYHWTPADTYCDSCNTDPVSPTTTSVYTVYATADGCPGPITRDTVTVKPVPAVPVLSGNTNICPGGFTSLTATATFPGTVTPTYVWGPSAGLSCTTCDPVTVSPATTMLYSVTAVGSGCPGAPLSFTVTVHPVTITSISRDTICIGGSASVTATETGGTTYVWTGPGGVTSTALTATFSPSVTTVYTLTVSNSFSCTATDTARVTVIPPPSAGHITGTDTVCPGGIITLHDSVAGGTWSSGSAAIATVDAHGDVNGITTGTTVIYYTVTNGYCNTAATYTVHVVAPPVIPPITGTDTICVAATTALADADHGGTWSSHTPAIATVNPATGVVTGISGGIAVIAYDVLTYCGIEEVDDTIDVVPPFPPITGLTALCSGTTAVLHDLTTGGTWSSSNPAVASINPVTGAVTGISSGVATISYMAANVCGAFTVTTTVGVNTPPYITTNFKIACQSLGTNTETHGSYILSDTSGCIKVCDSTVVRYYGNGVDSSVFTWAVTGGTIVHTYPGNDSIDIFWPIAGTTGTILLSDTFSHCIASTLICVQVIQKPKADFVPSAYTICTGLPVSFTDLSTADSLSPIVSYAWSFGDGTGSDIVSPSHTYATGSGSGTYTVTLVVKNACNCSDTFRVVLHVIDAPGKSISCASIVCDSQRATYSITTDGCTGRYTWSVTGGTILSGEGTTTVTVAWNDVDSSGYGYVRVVDPCAACPDTSTIKIPIILDNAEIAGPDVICANAQYDYSLPLWPGTQYMWGVIDHPEAIVSYTDDYKLTVDFTVPGTYTIHGWYQNELALCGGNVFKTITVEPAVTITGNTTYCQDATADFMAGGTSVLWTLSALTGTPIISETEPEFHFPFYTPGTFLLTATGSVCSNPVTINVLALPTLPDSIAGPDTVCLGRVYSYTAFRNVPGETYVWTAVNGTVSPASGSAIVNVVWNGGGPMSLSVSRVSTSSPYCQGAPLTIAVGQEVINPAIAGDAAPCANAYRPYHTPYTRAEVYDWSVYPNTAGSVVIGTHATAALVLWNNVTVPTSAAVVLTVHKCDSIVSDTFNVLIQPDPLVVITGTPNPACPEMPVSFTATGSDSAYIWNFGDGTPALITTAGAASHAFPLNTTTGNMYYTVDVTALPGISFGCPASGTSTFILTVLPGPVAVASTAFPLNSCSASFDYLLTGTVTDNITAPVYQWYGGSSVTTDTADATGFGSYYFKVTGSDGCFAISNTLTFTEYCPPTGGADTSDTTGMGGIPGGCGGSKPVVTTSDACNTIMLNETGGTAPYWLPIEGLPTSLTSSGTSATATYREPGIYRLVCVANVGVCLDTVNAVDTVGILPSFRYGISCAAGGLDSLHLTDYSAYMPWWTIMGINWLIDGAPYGGGGSTLTVLLPAGTTHVITEIVFGTRPGGTFNCPYVNTITIPGLPHASFTDTLSPICETVPINFTATSTAGIVGYDWDFGDHSSSLLENPQRAYLWNPGSDPNPYYVTLTVTDSIGCTSNTTDTVNIYQNGLGGNTGPLDLAVCSNNAPVTLTFISTPSFAVTSYLWSTGATTPTISVDTSGAYWVTVVGPYQCQGTFGNPVTTKVKVLVVPPALISGLQNYCIGQTVSLSGYAGTSVFYQWYRNGAADGTTPTIADAGLTPGTYNYQLVLGVTDAATLDTCYDTSSVYTVNMYPLPAPPNISAPVALSCSDYQVSLTATASEGGTFNWSDGTVGAVDSTIYSGGAYEVWFTDVYGCISSVTQDVPMSDEYYFQYFPSGCYTLCKQQLPLTLYGPPDAYFTSWAWLDNDTTALSGIGTMSPYSVTGAGDYQWQLNNRLCTQQSANMDISVENCVTQGVFTASVTCEPQNTGSYVINVVLFAPFPGTTYTLGTDLGPVTPFSGTLPTTGSYTVSLAFTSFAPAPATIEVEVIYTYPDGSTGFGEVSLTEPPCTWMSTERNSGDTTKHTGNQLSAAPSALLVFPNPASGAMTISYDYGSGQYTDRSLDIYDAMGRKTQHTSTADVHGNWNLNTADWTPGIYILRMTGDGKALQTQQIVITH